VTQSTGNYRLDFNHPVEDFNHGLNFNHRLYFNHRLNFNLWVIRKPGNYCLEFGEGNRTAMTGTFDA
jgi:hypothetical protein